MWDFDKNLIFFIFFVFLLILFLFYYSSKVNKELESILVFPIVPMIREEEKRMCDWDCSKEKELILYSRTVGKTEVCQEELKIYKNGQELKCILLGAFLRNKKEIEDMCQRDWVICE